MRHKTDKHPLEMTASGGGARKMDTSSHASPDEERESGGGKGGRRGLGNSGSQAVRRQGGAATRSPEQGMDGRSASEPPRRAAGQRAVDREDMKTLGFGRESERRDRERRLGRGE